VTVFRPSVIYGPGDTFLNMFARLLRWAPVFPLGNHGARLQPIFVEDVARAYLASLTNPATFGQRYNLCGPRAYTLRELVAYVARTCGYRSLILPLGDRLSYLQAWLFDKLPVKLLTLDNYHTLQTDNVCNEDFPAAIFGFSPIPLEDVAGEFLTGDTPHAHYREFRSKAGR
jgi:NADH dehydrogenase